MDFSQGLCIVYCICTADPLLVSSLSPGLAYFWVCQINNPSHSHPQRWGWCHLAIWSAATTVVIYFALVSSASCMGEVRHTWPSSIPSDAVRCPRTHLCSLDNYKLQTEGCGESHYRVSHLMQQVDAESLWRATIPGKSLICEVHVAPGTAGCCHYWTRAGADHRMLLGVSSHTSMGRKQHHL